MKIVDEKETHKTTNIKSTRKGRKEEEGTETTLKGWELHDFVVNLI